MPPKVFSLKSLVIGQLALSAMLFLTACTNSADSFPRVANPPEFDFIDGQNLRTGMHQLVFELQKLDLMLLSENDDVEMIRRMWWRVCATSNALRGQSGRETVTPNILSYAMIWMYSWRMWPGQERMRCVGNRVSILPGASQVPVSAAIAPMTDRQCTQPVLWNA